MSDPFLSPQSASSTSSKSNPDEAELTNQEIPPVRIVAAALAPKAQQPSVEQIQGEQQQEEQNLQVAELVDVSGIPEASVAEAPRRGWIRRVVYFLGSCFEWLFGLMSLFLGLAVLATIPIVQFISLGYLLEVSGRITRGGRLRDGFFGIRRAARIGSFIFGAWLWLLPLRLISDLWYSAELISPGSAVSRNWRMALVVSTILIVGHICWAWLRGGRFRHFLWPAPLKLLRSLPRMREVLSNASDATWNFAESLRIPYFFWLGARGFAGAVTWLFLPITLLAVAHSIPDAGGAAVGFVGGVLFAAVLLYLPFLQAHFAAENRFTAFFEVGEVRRMFRRAPVAFWFALLVTLSFALPLYLLKIEVPPSEITWIPSLFFVGFIFPARMLTGWSLSRAKKRELPRHAFFRWTARLAALPIITVYAFIVYFTMYFTWYGAWSLFEQHPFLVPTPFLGA